MSTAKLHGLDARAKRRREGALKRRARAALPKLVDFLVREHRARRVVLIGSLAEGRFDIHSDIDLLVEGLSFDLLLNMVFDVSLIAGMHVDIIRAETITEGWRDYHDRYGKVLYEERTAEKDDPTLA